MKKVTVYSTPICPFCARAKALLEEKNIPFEDIDLSQDLQKREEIQAKTGHMTVPMIFIGEEFIGGFDELSALEAEGKLDDLL